jgi:hypothetical protein
VTLPEYLVVLLPDRKIALVDSASARIANTFAAGAYPDALLRRGASEVLVADTAFGPDGEQQSTLHILDLETLNPKEAVRLDPRRLNHTVYHPSMVLSGDEGTLFYTLAEHRTDLPGCADRPIARDCDIFSIASVAFDNPSSSALVELPLGCGWPMLTRNRVTGVTVACSDSGQVFDVTLTTSGLVKLELSPIQLPMETDDYFRGDETRVQYAFRLSTGALSVVLSDGTLITRSVDGTIVSAKVVPDNTRPLTAGGDDAFLLDGDRLVIAFAGRDNYSIGKPDGLVVVDATTARLAGAPLPIADARSLQVVEGGALAVLGEDSSLSLLGLSGERTPAVASEPPESLLGYGVLIR